MLKSFKLGFNSSLTENFQMYKLDLEKAEKPETKLKNIHWITEKATVTEKHLILLY